MKKLLIKQAIFLPVVYFGFIFLSGFFADDYSHFGQHASELGVNANKTAVLLFKLGIIATSISLFLLAIGMKLTFKNRFNLTAVLIFAFGVTFIFGAIYPIGSPWHGVFGVGLFIMMVPFVFLYELNRLIIERLFHTLTIVAGFIMFFYLWSIIARLDPVDYRGLTQRIFGLVVFGWFSYVAYKIYRLTDAD